ncbi:MAG: hypothetical protein K2X48_16590, partial [Chitinophagaceae bacterium]|nr:hypothetical protein [Chitinophagaceae bacterium]
KTDTPGLPPATQTGANTFGFLLNGQPWIPQGNNGSGNNLSIDYDPGIRNGVIGINAYKVISSSSNDEHFGLGYWSLNSTTSPVVINLKDTTKSICYFLTTNNCWLVSNYKEVTVSGILYIDKYDKISRIIAGRFDFRLEKLGCTTIDISKGRFDFKF